MATGGAGTNSSPQAVPHPSHSGAPAPEQPSAAVSPPSKRELASWWKKFRKTTEKTDEKVESAPGIFGVPLDESIRYANVAISLTDEEGESFIYGYVPIVVAKCGVFLKEKATDVEGIFRLSGSAKRIKDLQVVFNSPDRYGKGLDWTGYTVHDAANILRRYLNQLPEPIVPLDFYELFREPLRPFLARSGAGEASFDLTMDQQSQVVAAYQKLITELPPLNRQLLLYILDLLAVFSSKSDLNRMNAANLAAIFQPGIISHPQHDMAPTEYRLSQDVLIFLIENQDHFLFGMSGTGIDEKTKQDVESGIQVARTPKSAIGRSASNASAGADSLRRYGVRRNVSVGSKGSRERSSPGVSSPATPTGPGQMSATSTSGVARSNTVPSKRSPAITSGRFHRMQEATSTESPTTADAGAEAPPTEMTAQRATTGNVNPSAQRPEYAAAQIPAPTAVNTSGPPPGQRDRKISNLLSRSPLFGPIDPQGKKLQKRRGVGYGAHDSAQSSQASLQGDEQAAFQTPLITPELNSSSKGDPIRTNPAVTNTSATPTSEQPALSPTSAERPNHTPHLQPPRSPAASVHSRSSITDHSEFDTIDNMQDPNARGGSAQASAEKDKKRHRWRFSSSAKKGDDLPLVLPPPIGENSGAKTSNSSISSAPGKAPRKSFTGDSQATTVHSGADGSSTMGGSTGYGHSGIQGQSSHESAEALRDSTNMNNGEEKRGGLFGKWKAKRSEKKEREAEKERAKSPPRGEPRNSLSAFAHDHFGPGAAGGNLASRGRGSLDRDRSRGGSSANEGVGMGSSQHYPPGSGQHEQRDVTAAALVGQLETVNERPVTEAREKDTTSGIPVPNPPPQRQTEVPPQPASQSTPQPEHAPTNTGAGFAEATKEPPPYTPAPAPVGVGVSVAQPQQQLPTAEPSTVDAQGQEQRTPTAATTTSGS